MDLWKIFESFDPDSKDVFLDVVHASAVGPAHSNLQSKVLTGFQTFRETHSFLERYTKVLSMGTENPILEICCGQYQHTGCDVGPCFLGVTLSYRCAYRDRFKKGVLKS